MKLKKNTVFLYCMFFLVSVLFWGCRENAESKVKIISGDTIEIQPREILSLGTAGSFWNADDGIICVLFGYGFNDEAFLDQALSVLGETFGLAESGGLVFPVVFPGDLHNRISNFRETVDRNNVHGIILLGAPENTHNTLARIIEDWDGKPPFNIFSLFPQDDILGQEGTCTFVLDYESSSGVHFGDEQQKDSGSIMDILVSAVGYASLLPAPLPADNELHSHVQAVAGNRKVARYTDTETGIQARNHFIIESAEQD